MSVKKTISMNSNIYHHPECRYARSIKDKNLMTISQKSAQRKGLIQCKCCNSMQFYYKCEKQAIDLFNAEKGMDFLYSRNSLYVKTSESCWKLAYFPAAERIGLFHRNYSKAPINFQYPWREKYHKQADRFEFISIEDALDYIFEHDKFQSAINAGVTDPIVSNKKYKNAAKRAVKKRERKRIDYLFRVIESQFTGVEDFRQYSIC